MSTDYDNLHNLVKQRKNIFLTGPGGSGKSYLIHKLRDELQDSLQFSVTSTTGVSSYLIKGQTIHRFSGIGILSHNYIIKDVIKKMKKNKAIPRILECDVLVIDEISMLGKKYVNVLNETFKIIRKNQKPFGGICLIVTGDFYQLPPINDDYAFESESWLEAEFNTILLEKVYRFHDEKYASLLSRARKAEHLPEDNVELFKRVKAYQDLMKLETELEEDESKKNVIELEIKPVYLMSKREDVDAINKEELNKNPNESVYYIANDNTPDKTITSLLDMISPRVLELKVGAQVMLMVNINVEEGLVNGLQGVITSLESDLIFVKRITGEILPFERHEFKMEEDGKHLGTRLQFPLKLAFCLSIHKSQGCSLDKAIIDLGNSVFENHMAYVGLSRLRSLDGLYLKKFNPYRITVDPKVVEFYKTNV